MQATNIASNSTSEGVPNSLILPLTNAVAGSNLLAVEVHQGTLPSSDIVFGMSLDGYTILTNAPSLSPPVRQGDGSLQVVLSGIPGRDYLIEASTNLVDWAEFSRFTGFDSPTTPVVLPVDPAGHRFFRPRLLR